MRHFFINETYDFPGGPNTFLAGPYISLAGPNKLYNVQIFEKINMKIIVNYLHISKEKKKWVRMRVCKVY